MICGKCAKDAGMTADERIKLALERMDRGVCRCPSCGKVHKWRLYRPAEEQPAPVVPVATPAPAAVAAVMIAVEPEPEQLSLF